MTFWASSNTLFFFVLQFFQNVGRRRLLRTEVKIIEKKEKSLREQFNQIILVFILNDDVHKLEETLFVLWHDTHHLCLVYKLLYYVTLNNVLNIYFIPVSFAEFTSRPNLRTVKSWIYSMYSLYVISSNSLALNSS